MKKWCIVLHRHYGLILGKSENSTQSAPQIAYGEIRYPFSIYIQICYSFSLDKSWLSLTYREGDKIMRPAELESSMSEPPVPCDDNILNRVYGCMMGLALGDALGAHVEFRPRDYLLANPVKDLVGGGTWGLTKGQVRPFYY